MVSRSNSNQWRNSVKQSWSYYKSLRETVIVKVIGILSAYKNNQGSISHVRKFCLLNTQQNCTSVKRFVICL